MRDLIIQEIIKNYQEKGLDETDIDLICSKRKIRCPGLYYDHKKRSYIIEDIENVLKFLYDPELLIILRAQHCQAFR